MHSHIYLLTDLACAAVVLQAQLETAAVQREELNSAYLDAIEELHQERTRVAALQVRKRARSSGACLQQHTIAFSLPHLPAAATCTLPALPAFCSCSATCSRPSLTCCAASRRWAG